MIACRAHLQNIQVCGCRNKQTHLDISVISIANQTYSWDKEGIRIVIKVELITNLFVSPLTRYEMIRRSETT
jgi:hypothetical protein